MCNTLNRISSWVRVLVTALLTLIVYVAAHEGGHAVAGIAAGYRVTDLSIFSLEPGVMLFGQGSPEVRAAIAVSGSAGVLLLWLGIVRRRGLFSQLFGFCAGVELLAWFVSAAIHALAPQGNDVTKFIDLSGANPANVALATLLIAGVCWRVYVRATPAIDGAGQSASAFSTAETSSVESGATLDSKRLITLPSLPTRNLVKFHLTSPPVDSVR